MANIVTLLASAGLLWFLCAGCESRAVGSRTHRVTSMLDYTDTRLSSSADVFLWQARGPLEFVEMLQRERFAYTVVGYHHNWVLEQDIPGLVALLERTNSCAPVVAVTSSQIPREPSTVAREAAFMIHGFRTGYYPPEISSEWWCCEEEDLKIWYRQWVKGRR